MNSKQKGNGGERELARLLREWGYDTRRGLQYQSGQVEADVVGLPGLHIECKRVQGLDIKKAMAQSIRDAKEEEIPVVIHRENRKPWSITLRLGDLVEICALNGFWSDGLVTLLLADFMPAYTIWEATT
jgi:hypothetical protein